MCTNPERSRVQKQVWWWRRERGRTRRADDDDYDDDCPCFHRNWVSWHWWTRRVTSPKPQTTPYWRSCTASTRYAFFCFRSVFIRVLTLAGINNKTVSLPLAAEKLFLCEATCCCALLWGQTLCRRGETTFSCHRYFIFIWSVFSQKHLDLNLNSCKEILRPHAVVVVSPPVSSLTPPAVCCRWCTTWGGCWRRTETLSETTSSTCWGRAGRSQLRRLFLHFYSCDWVWNWAQGWMPCSGARWSDSPDVPGWTGTHEPVPKPSLILLACHIYIVSAYMLSDMKTVILEIIMQKWSLQYVIIISFSVFILSLCTDIILDVKLKDVIIESQQKTASFSLDV